MTEPQRFASQIKGWARSGFVTAEGHWQLLSIAPILRVYHIFNNNNKFIQIAVYVKLSEWRPCDRSPIVLADLLLCAAIDTAFYLFSVV